MRGHIAILVRLLVLAWAAWIPAERVHASTSHTRVEPPLGPLGATLPHAIARSECIQFVLLGIDTCATFREAAEHMQTHPEMKDAV